MDNSKIKRIMYLILFLLVINIASAANMTIQQLIDSFDYSYNDGTINVTSQNDYMVDRNNDGSNDTLIVNITTNAATTGTYAFIVKIIDNNGLIVNDTSKSITASDNSSQVNFPSELLSNTKFNYSIIINDNNNNLVFRKFNIESQIYKNYETGLNITKIRDENLNNNYLKINLTINSPKAVTTNVTVALAYNSSTISATQEKSLSSGVQVISINFDNETIKSTHYNGNFTIDAVAVGNKLFDFNQNTSSYNYENFAKTSYIKSISDGRRDLDNDGSFDFLDFNFTVEIKTVDTYTVTYDVYDGFDNFVLNLSKSKTLGTGQQIIQTQINGTEIYKTKIDGPYLVSFAKLHIGNDTKDVIFDSHSTNLTFYTDYERPPLPDLRVLMESNFDSSTNVTNVTINLSNIGSAEAFNVFLDVFDNNTYEDNKSLAFLNNNEHAVYKFNITNSSKEDIVTAIVDLENLVDESDETNNIVQNVLPDLSKFYFINSSGSNVAWFGDAGNIVLKGMLEQNSNYIEQPNDLFAMEEQGNVFFVMAQNGSMYIDGTLTENYAGELTSPDTVNNLGIYGSDGKLVGLLNTSGYLFLKGTLTQNGNP